MMPRQLLVDCEDELTSLKSVVCEIDMPLVDIEAALDQVFEVLAYEDFDQSLKYAAKEIAIGESLLENIYEGNGQHERINAAFLQFGHAMHEKLAHLGVYVHGVFPYRLRRVVSNDTLLFSYTGPSADYTTA